MTKRTAKRAKARYDKSAAAEPALERTPPQLFQLMQCADADYICLGDKYVLTRIGKDALSQERAANIIADYNAEAAKVLARAVAVPESAAQQESAFTPIELQAIMDALLFTEENSGLVSDAHCRVKEKLRARQAEPAPKPSRPLKTGDKCIIRGTVVGIQTVDVGWSPTCENVLEVMVSDQTSIWLRERNVVAEASAIGTKEQSK
jgi:hypothetical protein